jgi:phospholipase/lecithinase/hemolysin
MEKLRPRANLAVLFLGIACTAGACSTPPNPCSTKFVALCGHDTFQLTTCGAKGNTGDRGSSIHPPDFFDVPPALGSGLPMFPPSIPVDVTEKIPTEGLVRVTIDYGREQEPDSGRAATPLSIRTTGVPKGAMGANGGPLKQPNQFGHPAYYNPADDSVGKIVWTGKDPNGDDTDATGVLIHPRVVLTSAHGLLAANEDANTDLSTRVYTFAATTNDGGTGTSYISHKGWAQIHPLYDPATRAFDIAFIVLQSSMDARFKPQPFATYEGLDSCSCPLQPDMAIVVSMGRGNTDYGDGISDIPAENDFGPAKRRRSLAEILGVDGVAVGETLPPGTLHNSHGGPSVEFFSTRLFANDVGAPIFHNLDNVRYVIGLYSGPDSVISRRATRLTPGIINWIVQSVSGPGFLGPDSPAMAAVPPSGWPPGGHDPTDPRYKIDPPPDTGKGLRTSDWGGGTKEVIVSAFQACESGPSTPPPPVDVAHLDNIVIIGDSLSDQHNQYLIYVSGQTPGPGKGYWNGRFTNGYNWVDYFVKDNPTLQVVNLSVGGAFAFKERGIGGIIGATPTIMWEANNTAKNGDSLPRDLSNSLVVIWAGPNDINAAARQSDHYNLTPTGMAEGVASGYRDVIRLVRERGAKHILLGGAPPLNLVPVAQPGTIDGYQGDALAYATEAVAVTNTELLGIASGIPGGQLLRVDTFIAGVCEPPDDAHRSVNAYNLRYSCVNQTAKDLLGWRTYVDSRCQGYVYFDNLHPSTIAHCGLAQFFEDQMAESGTYTVNRGGGAPNSRTVREAIDGFCAKQPQNDASPTMNYPRARRRAYYARVDQITDDGDASQKCMMSCTAPFTWAPMGDTILGRELVGWFNVPVPLADNAGQAAATSPPVQISPGFRMMGEAPMPTDVGGCLCTNLSDP